MCTSSFQNDNVRLSPLVVNVFTNTSINSFIFIILNKLMSGADPRFQVRGGGAHLKKLRRAVIKVILLACFTYIDIF
jgi:hypothetical protein